MLKNGSGLSPRFFCRPTWECFSFVWKSALPKYCAGRHYMLTCVTTYMHAVAAPFAAYLPISGHKELLQERDALGQLRDLLQQRQALGRQVVCEYNALFRAAARQCSLLC